MGGEMRFLCKSWIPVERLHRYFWSFFDKNGFLRAFAYAHNPSGNSETLAIRFD